LDSLKGTILVNFYVRLAKPYKEFLDNSSEGSVTHCIVAEAWELLEKISKNADNWDLDKGNEPTLQYDFECVKIFSLLEQFKDLTEKFNLDHHVIIEVVKSFAESDALSKEGFTAYEPPKIIEPTPMVLEHVESMVTLTANEFYEKPPYPAKIGENNKILDTIMSKSAKKSCIPYEQVQVHPHVYAIKTLNQEEQHCVYLCEMQLEL
jgi:hypothetical protein